MPTLVLLLLLCLDTFALGVLVTAWFVFEVGWMGGGGNGDPTAAIGRYHMGNEDGR